MIDSILLDVGCQGECELEPGSELEDFRIFGYNDDRIIRIEADLDPSNKAQLKNLREEYKDIFT